MYTHQDLSDVTVWDERLCGFDRVHLDPGESKTVTMVIKPECLAIWNLAMKRVVEPGTFKVLVGASSADIKLKGGFEVVQ